jgi:hypothetical protein
MTDGSDIGFIVREFTEHIDSLASSALLSETAMQDAQKAAWDKYRKFTDDNCKEKTVDGRQMVEVPNELYPSYRSLEKKAAQARIAQSVVPAAFFVSLVTQYDAFLGRLVSALFRRKPELLKVSECALTFLQLSDFGSIEAARDFILDKEAETLLRKSRAEQFAWLENEFEITLRSHLPVWPAFIEVTERRNLFIHSGGVVTAQYLRVCEKEGVKFDPAPQIGQKLGVSQKYFPAARAALYQIGVKLAQVLWRKLFPLELANADDSLIELTHELIVEGEYELAKTFLDFAHNAPFRHADERRRLICLVNKAQAYKWSGDMAGTLEAVNKQDWSATTREFQLAEAVLLDRFELAGRLMQRIGPTGNVSQAEYKSRPLYQHFRKTKEFLDTYKEVFGEPFSKSELIEKLQAKDEPN